MLELESLKLQSKEAGFYFEKLNRLGALCWTYSTGAKTTAGKNILKVFCPICHKDPLTKDVNDRGLFTQTMDGFKKSVRCGCSKGRARVLSSLGVDIYIGEKKTTKEGNTLTIDSVKSTDKGKIRTYNITCSVCSLDKELYPLESLSATVGNFFKENFNPCGCGVKENLTLKQKKIKIERIIKDDPFLIFKGFTENSYNKGKHCYLKLQCLKHNHYWESTCFNNFLYRYLNQNNNNNGCEYCKRSVSREIGRKINNGVYLGKECEEDTLYLLKVTINDDLYFKIGRSFNLKRRIKLLENDIMRNYPENSNLAIEVIKTYTDNHANIANFEQHLHELNNINKNTPIIKFSGYSEFFYYNPTVLNNFNGFIKNL